MFARDTSAKADFKTRLLQMVHDHEPGWLAQLAKDASALNEAKAFLIKLKVELQSPEPLPQDFMADMEQHLGPCLKYPALFFSPIKPAFEVHWKHGTKNRSAHTPSVVPSATTFTSPAAPPKPRHDVYVYAPASKLCTLGDDSAFKRRVLRSIKSSEGLQDRLLERCKTEAEKSELLRKIADIKKFLNNEHLLPQLFVELHIRDMRQNFLAQHEIEFFHSRCQEQKRPTLDYLDIAALIRFQKSWQPGEPGSTELLSLLKKHHISTALPDTKNALQRILQTFSKNYLTQYFPDTTVNVAAATGNHLACGLHLLSGTDVNSSDNYGNSVLAIAVAKKHFKLVEILILLGADVNQKNERSIPPLLQTVYSIERYDGARDEAKKDFAHAFKLLAQSNLDLCVHIDKHMETYVGEVIPGCFPLQIFGERYGKKAIKLLLDHGADLLQRDRFGEPAVTSMSAPDVVAYLHKKIHALFLTLFNLKKMMLVYQLREKKEWPSAFFTHFSPTQLIALLNQLKHPHQEKTKTLPAPCDYYGLLLQAAASRLGEVLKKDSLLAMIKAQDLAAVGLFSLVTDENAPNQAEQIEKALEKAASEEQYKYVTDLLTQAYPNIALKLKHTGLRKALSRPNAFSRLEAFSQEDLASFVKNALTLSELTEPQKHIIQHYQTKLAFYEHCPLIVTPEPVNTAEIPTEVPMEIDEAKEDGMDDDTILVLPEQTLTVFQTLFNANNDRRSPSPEFLDEAMAASTSALPSNIEAYQKIERLSAAIQEAAAKTLQSYFQNPALTKTKVKNTVCALRYFNPSYFSDIFNDQRIILPNGETWQYDASAVKTLSAFTDSIITRLKETGLVSDENLPLLHYALRELADLIEPFLLFYANQFNGFANLPQFLEWEISSTEAEPKSSFFSELSAYMTYTEILANDGTITAESEEAQAIRQAITEEQNKNKGVFNADRSFIEEMIKSYSTKRFQGRDDYEAFCSSILAKIESKVHAEFAHQTGLIFDTAKPMLFSSTSPIQPSVPLNNLENLASSPSDFSDSDTELPPSRRMSVG